MVDIRPVIHILGLLTCCIAAMLCLPALADLAYHNRDWETFLLSALAAMFLGTLMAVTTRSATGLQINLRQAFLVTTLGWVMVALIAAVPFLGLGMSLTDAVFESMSGITTTGSTVLVNLDSLPPGILLWRGLIQWIGGMGIIAIAILMLPLLRVGGMQLFRIEHPGGSEDRIAGTLRLIVSLMLIYSALTLACGAFYYLFGMTGFDAITHAMTTLSTGGYSTHDASFGYFKDLRIHWVATVFMIAGAIPFYLYVKAVRGNVRSILTDQQVRGFVGFVAVASILMAYWLFEQRDIGFGAALTLTTFNITSIVTTTGYASEDYTAWGPGAVGVFLVLMFVGGCSGSTSGAIKIYRCQVLYLVARAHIRRLFSPHRVIVLKYNGKVLQDDVSFSVLAFLAVFVATIAVFTIALALLGLDLVTAYSASVTAITNVGPGLGSIIGPAGNFQPLPDAAKWLLSAAMLAGRLEVLALLVALEPDFWRF